MRKSLIIIFLSVSCNYFKLKGIYFYRSNKNHKKCYESIPFMLHKVSNLYINSIYMVIICTFYINIIVLIALQ